jgi:glycosyltransferase involved in cell wall biosynthesis
VSHDLAGAGIKADFILPVGVDTRLFSPPPERKHQEPTVLFVGTVIERKGANLFVMQPRLFRWRSFS